MQGVILAGGQGTRLGSLTRNRSKAMLPILGVPLVCRVIDSLLANGLRDLICVVNPGDVEIRPHLLAHVADNAHIEFVVQPRPRGTAHALKVAAALIHGDFLLSACDSLVPDVVVRRLLDRWSAEPIPDAVFCLQRVPATDLVQRAVVTLKDEWVCKIVEKPVEYSLLSGIASLPLYVLPEKILSMLSGLPLSLRGEYELQDVFQSFIDRGGRIASIFCQMRWNLTFPRDLLQINRHFLQATPPPYLYAPGSEVENTQLIPPVHIQAPVLLEPGCVIGPNVFIEGGCRIGRGARIAEAVVLRGAVIDAGETIQDKVIAGEDHHGSSKRQVK